MTHAAAQPKNPRFHSGTISNFRFDLATNLAILATLLVACHLRNLARPDLDLSGGYAYLMLASTALVFDAALAFLVFACARRRYGKSSTPGAFVGACERLRTGQRARSCAGRTRIRRARARAGDVPVIRTSAYTGSRLPM